MPVPSFFTDYNDFMKWFRITHPVLHEKYSPNIEAPRDITGLRVNHDNIDDSTYDLICQIENDYYLRIID